MTYESDRRPLLLALLGAFFLLADQGVQAQSGNTVLGTDAMLNNTTGSKDTAIGENTLLNNSSGSFNIALGYEAMGLNTTGVSNVAAGTFALGSTTGDGNVAVGGNALARLATGGANVAVGINAGYGYTAAESNNIVFGNAGVAGESGVIRIGGTNQTSAYIAGVSGATSASGVAVYVNTSGKLGTAVSSLRFKDDVQPMGAASDGLMQLRPVTFHYRPQFDDGSRLLQYGLVAEEVAKVYPDLVQYDAQGQPLAVRYQFVDAMLLNEVQVQHRQLAAQEARIADLERQLQALAARQK